jgi:hypothetical protein
MQHFDTWEGRAKPATTRLLEEGGKQGQELKNTGSYRRLVTKWKAGEEETVGNSRKETKQKTKSNVRMCHSDYDRDLNRKVNHSLQHCNQLCCSEESQKCEICISLQVIDDSSGHRRANGSTIVHVCRTRRRVQWRANRDL